MNVSQGVGKPLLVGMTKGRGVLTKGATSGKKVVVVLLVYYEISAASLRLVRLLLLLSATSCVEHNVNNRLS